MATDPDDPTIIHPGDYIKTFVAGKTTASIPLRRLSIFDLREDDFQSPNALLHHLAELANSDDLRKRAAAGEGAWITGHTIHYADGDSKEVQVGPIRIEHLKMAYAQRPSPPQLAIDFAIHAARMSPCHKSQRGACVFQPFTGHTCQAGHNGRPDKLCDHACRQHITSNVLKVRSTCGAMAVHAEVRAIRSAIIQAEVSTFAVDGTMQFFLQDCELVHVKVVDGELVPSGGPSCIDCAKEVLDVDLLGVWLYETVSIGMEGNVERWNFYPAKVFWDETRRACGL